MAYVESNVFDKLNIFQSLSIGQDHVRHNLLAEYSRRFSMGQKKEGCKVNVLACCMQPVMDGLP